MAADKPPHARRVDWQAAREFFLALDPPRSYQTVADAFTVSRQRVRFIAKRDNWESLAADVDARAAEQAKQRAVRTRAERVRKVLGIVDGLVDRYDAELADLELRPADLDRIVKLAELLEGEATDRMEFSEVQAFLGRIVKVAAKFIPKAKLQVFLDEIRGLADQADEQEAA